MGLFGKGECCSICGGSKSVKTIVDGSVCQNCINKCGNFLLTFSWKTVPLQRVKEAMADNEINQQRQAIFHSTKLIEKILEIDENNKLWKLKAYGNIYFSYDDIADYECVKNGNSMFKIGVGRAIVGGMLFGGAGAILGGLSGTKQCEEITEFRILIHTKVASYPELSINLLPTGKVKSDSFSYKSYCDVAEKIMNSLNELSGKIEEINAAPAASSVPEEIMNYKRLLDEGAITEEEFESKKRQLLGL